MVRYQPLAHQLLQDHKHCGGSAVLFLSTVRRSLCRRGVVLLPPPLPSPVEEEGIYWRTTLASTLEAPARC